MGRWCPPYHPETALQVPGVAQRCHAAKPGRGHDQCCRRCPPGQACESHMSVQQHLSGLLGAPPACIVSPTRHYGQHMVGGQGGFHMPRKLIGACPPTLHADRGVPPTANFTLLDRESHVTYCMLTPHLFLSTPARVTVACFLFRLETESPHTHPSTSHMVVMSTSTPQTTTHPVTRVSHIWAGKMLTYQL
jgi:hypothetical protein